MTRTDTVHAFPADPCLLPALPSTRGWAQAVYGYLNERTSVLGGYETREHANIKGTHETCIKVYFFAAERGRGPKQNNRRASMDPQAAARRYRRLREEEQAADVESAAPLAPEGQRPINFATPMHSEAKTGMMSIMNLMFSAHRYERRGRETESFKLAVLQWSSAYAVAYALMMTIAFSMLVTRPLPAEQKSADETVLCTCNGNSHARGHAVNDGADAFAVALAKGGDAEDLAEGRHSFHVSSTRRSVRG